MLSSIGRRRPCCLCCGQPEQATAPGCAVLCQWHTPNMITTYSFATGLLAVWALWHRRISLFMLLFSTSYIFDCLDGQFARRYDMCTKFGDVYDHVTDMFIYFAVLGVVLTRHVKPVHAAVSNQSMSPSPGPLSWCSYSPRCFSRCLWDQAAQSAFDGRVATAVNSARSLLTLGGRP